MKSFTALLALVSLTLATPLTYNLEQIPLNAADTTYPGFDLDLNALRLVEMDGRAPVWMTELEKVRIYKMYFVLRYLIAFISQIQAKAQGIKFFDM